MVENKWVSLGLFHPEISGVLILLVTDDVAHLVIPINLHDCTVSGWENNAT